MNVNRRNVILLFGAAHLLIITAVVTLAGWCLYGSASASYAGWSGGFVVAVWTLPLSAFAGHFLGTRARCRRDAMSKQQGDKAGTDKPALRE